MTDQPAVDPQAFKQFERDGYSMVADEYDKFAAVVLAQPNDAMLDAVGTKPGTRLLDVACGPGWLSVAAVKRGAIVTALDFAEKMVAIARVRCPEVELHTADAENLPFEAGRFDAVVCNLGLLHFPAPERAIAEAFRVLTPGGSYAFTCWTPLGRNPFMDLILGSVRAHGTLDVDLPAGPPLFRFGDPAECEQALRAAEFVSVSTREVPMVWPFFTAEDVVPQVLTATARLGAILMKQTPEQRRKIEGAIVEGAKRYATDRGVEIPTAVVLAVGLKAQ